MITIVAVEYDEPEYAQTRECIAASGLPVVWVDREGIGSLAEAYNRGFKSVRTPVVWFVSNIAFTPEVPGRLLLSLGDNAAVHPQFPSDHTFIRQGSGVTPAPFVEFTAPLVIADVFREFPLDEAMPYWGHDLDWGHRVRQAGHSLAVDHECRIDHVYVRHLAQHPVTIRRRRLRRSTDEATRAALVERYGEDWKERLCYDASSWTPTES